MMETATLEMDAVTFVKSKLDINVLEQELDLAPLFVEMGE